MRKRLIAAEAIEAGEALTCVDIVAGPDGGYDFKIGVLRMGDRDYYPGPLGFAEGDVAPGEVMREVENLDEVRLWAESQAVPWPAPVRSTPVAAIRALREEFRGLGRGSTP
jgi:hypothetical protein